MRCRVVHCQPLEYGLVPRKHVEPVAGAQRAPSHSTKQGVPFEIPLLLDQLHSFCQGQCLDDLGVPVGSGLALVNLSSCQMLQVIEHNYRKNWCGDIVQKCLTLRQTKNSFSHTVCLEIPAISSANKN